MKVIPESAMTDRRFPSAVRSMWRLAIAEGLESRLTFAQGPLIGQGGRLLEQEVASLCLALVGHGRAVVAEWHLRKSWKFTDAWMMNPATRLTSNELRRWIRGELEGQGTAWQLEHAEGSA